MDIYVRRIYIMEIYIYVYIYIYIYIYIYSAVSNFRSIEGIFGGTMSNI